MAAYEFVALRVYWALRWKIEPELSIMSLPAWNSKYVNSFSFYLLGIDQYFLNVSFTAYSLTARSDEFVYGFCYR